VLLKEYYRSENATGNRRRAFEVKRLQIFDNDVHDRNNLVDKLKKRSLLCRYLDLDSKNAATEEDFAGRAWQ
jgi:hypothetical protein